jgi:tetratricopeptide (TPR) repeat protein
MCVRAFLTALVALLLISNPILATSEQDWQDCEGKDYDRAIVACTRIIENSAETAASRARAYNNRGRTYRSRRDIGDLDRAISDYTEAIRLDPNNARGYYNRGDIYRERNLDRAIADLTAAIRLDPKYVSAYVARGWAYVFKDEYNRAIADYTEAIRIDATFAPAYSARASAYESTGHKTDAIADDRKALLLDPSDRSAAGGLVRLGAKPF